MFLVTHKVSPSPKSAYLNYFHIIQTSVDKNISIIIYYLFLLLLRSVVQKLVQGAAFGGVIMLLVEDHVLYGTLQANC